MQQILPLLILLSPLAMAAPIATEEFNYPVGGSAPMNGGTGWGEAWKSSDGTTNAALNITAGSLNPLFQSAVGNHLASNGTYYFRELSATAATAVAAESTNNGEVWISLTAHQTTGTYGNMALWNIGNTNFTSYTDPNYSLLLGMNPYSGDRWSWSDVTTVGAGGLGSVPVSTAVRYVMRLDYQPAKTGVTMYIFTAASQVGSDIANSSPATTVGNTVLDTSGNRPVFDRLTFSSDGMDFDSLHIGTTFADVVSTPQLRDIEVASPPAFSNSNAPQTYQIPVSNTGSGPLTLTGVSLSGVAASAFTVSSYPPTVAPGATANIELGFVPAGAFDHTVDLAIASDDPDEATKTVTVNVQVTSPPVAPYNAWASSFGLDPEDEGAPGNDADGDGLINSLEFLLGSNPGAANQACVPASGHDGSNFTFVYQRKTAAREAGFTEVVEHSSNLVDWSDALHGQGGVTITATAVNGNTENVSVVIPVAGQARHFARLKMLESPVSALAARLLPGHGDQFLIETIPSDNGQDVFEVASGSNGKIILRGNNPLTQAVALNHYLKYTAHVAVSWYVDAPIPNPATLPPVTTAVRKTTKLKNRFFFNYCTFGYTTPFWQWRDWERMIDWMALNGINMPLAQNGTEAIWQKVWRSYGLTDDEIRGDFTGPAHLPWNRMANICKWDGPLPQSYVDSQLALQKKILARERGYGMKPVLPAFAGRVPVALTRVRPGINLTPLIWPGIPADTNTRMLDASDPLFSEIQIKFLQEQQNELGTDHLYGSDPFNEMDPPSWDPAYLSAISGTIYQSMAQADPQALWVQMGWTFTPERGWTNTRLQKMIQGVPQGKMMLLDYSCEETENFRTTGNYFGAPFIWCYLGNFGGNNHIVGPLIKVNTRLTAAMNDASITNLAGIGATLEGLNNQSVYECLFERAWAGPSMDLQDWFRKQAQCHAGGPDQAVEDAFEILRTKVLVDNAQGIGGHGVIFQSVPRLVTNAQRGWVNPNMPYDNANLIAAWAKLLQAGPTARANDAYLFDLADVTRQALGNHGQTLRAQMLDVYLKKDAVAFRKLVPRFLEMGRDLDSFLATRSEFLLGKWVGDARAFGEDSAQKDDYERNARTLLTTWVGRGDYFTDYGSKCWNGLLSSYYLHRWEIYLNLLGDDLDNGEHNAAHQSAMEEQMKDFEWEWARQAGETFQSAAGGDVYNRSAALYQKYIVTSP